MRGSHRDGRCFKHRRVPNVRDGPGGIGSRMRSRKYYRGCFEPSRRCFMCDLPGSRRCDRLHRPQCNGTSFQPLRRIHRHPVWRRYRMSDSGSTSGARKLVSRKTCGRRPEESRSRTTTSAIPWLTWKGERLASTSVSNCSRARVRSRDRTARSERFGSTRSSQPLGLALGAMTFTKTAMSVTKHLFASRQDQREGCFLHARRGPGHGAGGYGAGGRT